MKPGEFGKKLRELREKEQLSLREVAKLAGYESHRAWSKVEVGDSEPTFQKAESMLQVLGYRLDVKIAKVK